MTVRFLKLAIRSGTARFGLELAEVQALEAELPGYVPLAARSPVMTGWTRSPHRAAQRGLEYLQSASTDWQARGRCFGCHVQGQAIMGLSVAKTNDYVVDDRCLANLVTFTRQKQRPDGAYHTVN